MNEINWLEMASEFDLGPTPVIAGKLTLNMKQEDLVEYHIYMKRKLLPDNSFKWGIYDGDRYVLSKYTLEFVYECFPSLRTEEFYKETRFETKEEAYECWLKAKKHFIEVYNDCNTEPLKNTYKNKDK